MTFRPIDNRDCALLRLPQRSARTSRVAPSRGHVVTIDGRIAVAFDRRGQVIYQDGSASVAELIRADRRVLAALSLLDYAEHRKLLRDARPSS